MVTAARTPVHTLTLKGRVEIAERTLEFRFERPAGLAFTSGQYLDLTLNAPPETDEEGNTRSFSICSSPDDEEIAIASRMRETAFKRSLHAAPLGTEVHIEGPYGDFTLHRNPLHPAVLLAGCIGVTPFRSMLRQKSLRSHSRRIILFHTNRRPEDAPYLEEFLQLSKELANFTYVPTVSQPQTSRLPWDGNVGRITPGLIAKHLQGSWAGPLFYIAGPPRMVADLRAVLVASGVSEDDLRSEEFAGY